MRQVGLFLTNLGFKLLPISFATYLVVSLLMYKLKKRHTMKLVKAIWYFSNASMLITGDVRVDTIAAMILFLESCDAILDYIESKK